MTNNARKSVATAIAKADGWTLPKDDLDTLPKDIKSAYEAQADAAIDAYESELQRQYRDNNDVRSSAIQFVRNRATSEDPSWWAQPILDIIEQSRDNDSKAAKCWCGHAKDGDHRNGTGNTACYFLSCMCTVYRDVDDVKRLNTQEQS